MNKDRKEWMGQQENKKTGLNQMRVCVKFAFA